MRSKDPWIWIAPAATGVAALCWLVPWFALLFRATTLANLFEDYVWLWMTALCVSSGAWLLARITRARWAHAMPAARAAGILSLLLVASIFFCWFEAPHGWGVR